MPNSQQATVVLTVVATGTIAKGRGVNWSGAQATDGTTSFGQEIIGVADHAAVAGEAMRVIFGVSAMAESGAALDGSEKRLKTDAQGRFIPWTSGSVLAARLLPGQTASAAGQLVEIVPLRVS